MSNEGLATAASAAVSKKTKAHIKSEIKRAIKPASAPIKKGLDEARKWTDKAARKVPVLGPLAALPLDVIDDLADDILIDNTKHKSGKFVPDRLQWQVPEFVDQLPMPLTANKLAVEVNPGPGKKRGRSMKKKRTGTRGLKKRNKMLLNYSGIQLPKARALKVSLPPRNVRGRLTKFRNKRTGVVQSGYKMVTSEYALGFDYSGSAAMGDELIQGGLLMNPHELKLPELNIEVQRWEYFRIKPVITLDGAPVQNVDAAVTCYFDPDPTDNLSGDGVKRIEVAEAHGGKPHKVTTMVATWKPNAARGAKVNFLKWFHCDTAGTTGADMRLQNQYRFRMLCYRPPKTYWNGAPTPIDVPMNLRVRYEIDFKVRTLDSVNDSSTGAAWISGVSTATPLSSATDYCGLATASSSTLANYTVDAALHNQSRYHFTTDSNVYRINRGIMPKYVMVGLRLGATTLTGNGAIGSLGNLTLVSVHTVSNTVSNINLWWGLFTVTNTQLKTSSAFGSTATYLQGTTLAKVLQAQYDVGWSFMITPPATVTTPDDFHIIISEFDEGPGLAKMKWYGPATVQGQAMNQYLEIPHLKRPIFGEFVRKYKAIKEQKLDEVSYWKNKALGRELEAKEFKEHKLQLVSDDEDDWLAYQQQKAAMHKSPGFMSMKPLKIVQDDEKSEKGAPRPKAGSQK